MERRSDDVSDLPAAARGLDHHTHPLPRAFRLVLVVYGLAIFVTLGGLTMFLVGERLEREQQIAKERRTSREADARQGAAISREIERLSARRDAREKALREQIDTDRAMTRAAVCALLNSGDLGTTPRIVALGRQLRCAP